MINIGTVLAAGIAHRLSAAGLFKWEVRIATQTLEQLKRRDANIGRKSVDETWNKQGNLHHISGGRDS